jgi:hypothetical protein
MARDSLENLSVDDRRIVASGVGPLFLNFTRTSHGQHDPRALHRRHRGVGLERLQRTWPLENPVHCVEWSSGGDLCMASEIIFIVEESAEGGYEARAAGHSVFAEAETIGELKSKILDAVRCHFDPAERPSLIRS